MADVSVEGGIVFAIVGLGNPGKRYARTRHNVGFWAIDRLADACGFPTSSSWQTKNDALIHKAEIAKVETLLILPQTYMNKSGTAVAPLVRFFKIPIENVIVVYDELDLSPGTIRIRRGGSAAGHRGIASLVECLGETNFVRFRVGIGHPRDLSPTPLHEDAVSNWVLAPPSAADQILLALGIDQVAQALPVLLAEGLEHCQQRFNRKPSES